MNPKLRPSLPCLEQLESRTLLSGNVIAVLSGTTLKITGDASANAITISSGSGGLVLSCGGSTTINGAASNPIFATPAQIKIMMGDGDDTLEFADGVSITKNVSIDTGTGEDGVAIGDVTIGGNLVITKSDGAVMIIMSASTINGALNVTTKAGDSLDITMTSVAVTKATTVTSKSTALTFTADGSQFGNNVTLTHKGSSTSTITFKNDAGTGLSVHGKLSITGGSDADTITLQDGTFTGKVTINTGAGESATSTVTLDGATFNSDVSFTSKEKSSPLVISDSTIAGSLTQQNSAGMQASLEVTNYSTVGKNLTIKAVSHVGIDVDRMSVAGKVVIVSGTSLSCEWGSAIQSCTFGSSVSVTAKSSSHMFDLSYVQIAGSLTINFGGGTVASTTSLTDVTVGGALTYKGSTGADTATLLNVNVTGASTFTMAAGNDILTINNGVFTKKATINMGDGNDSLYVQSIAGTDTEFNGGLSFQGGKGDDYAALGSSSASGRRVYLGATSMADGGAGTNTGECYLAPTLLTFTIKNFEA